MGRAGGAHEHGGGGGAGAGVGGVEDWSAERMLENEIPALSCLHYSLFWLLSRQFSRREDLFTVVQTATEPGIELNPES